MERTNFTIDEMTNAIKACEQMKEGVPAINAALFGHAFWKELSNKIANKEEDGGNSLVGIAIVTTELIPTSHVLYFGSVQDAMEMRKTLKMAKENGFSWEEVIELIKDSRKWDEEKLKWQLNDKR